MSPTRSTSLWPHQAGYDIAKVMHKQRLLSDNGSSYIAGDLAEYLDDKGMKPVRGASMHPQTQGKMERSHQNARKHGGAKRRVWRKIHIGVDGKSLEIRAAEFTTSDVGDAPMLPELFDQILPELEIASVTADGDFDTRKCHDAIAARGAAANIPPRKNAKPWKPDTSGAVA